MRRHVATVIAVVVFVALATATAELPDPEGAARDRPMSGSAEGPSAPARPLRLGVPLRGRIEESDPPSLLGPGRSDRFTIDLEAERTYTIDLRVDGWQRYDPDRPSLDPELASVTAAVLAGRADRPGGMVPVEDRVLPGVYSRAHVRPPQSGPHVITVRAEILGPNGSVPTYAGYEIRVVEAELPLCAPQDCFHVPPLPPVH